VKLKTQLLREKVEAEFGSTTREYKLSVYLKKKSFSLRENKKNWFLQPPPKKKSQ
jgi:hypothetical protein